MERKLINLLVQRYAEQGIEAVPCEQDGDGGQGFELSGLPCKTLDDVEAVMMACEKAERLAFQDFECMCADVLALRSFLPADISISKGPTPR